MNQCYSNLEVISCHVTHVTTCATMYEEVLLSMPDWPVNYNCLFQLTPRRQRGFLNGKFKRHATEIPTTTFPAISRFPLPDPVLERPSTSTYTVAAI